jgi:hypothetical protein
MDPERVRQADRVKIAASDASNRRRESGGKAMRRTNRAEMDAVIERKSKVVSRIIPGNWGKVRSGWLA